MALSHPAITARGAVPGVQEPMSIPPSEMEESIAEVTPALAVSIPPIEQAPAFEEVFPIVEGRIPSEFAVPPLRDQEEGVTT